MVVLSTLHRRFITETFDIQEVFRRATSCRRPNALIHLRAYAGEMAVIRLYDAWSRFCRNLVSVSAAGRPYTASNVRLSRAPGIRRPSDILPVLQRALRLRSSQEPRWGIAWQLIRCVNCLRIHNRREVSAAVGYKLSPANEVRILRNFFAHRSGQTAAEVKSCPAFNTSGPQLTVEKLAGQITTSGISLFDLWIVRFRNMAEAAIQ